MCVGTTQHVSVLYIIVGSLHNCQYSTYLSVLHNVCRYYTTCVGTLHNVSVLHVSVGATQRVSVLYNDLRCSAVRFYCTVVAAMQKINCSAVYRCFCACRSDPTSVNVLTISLCIVS
jgi:hypothetical protein